MRCSVCGADNIEGSVYCEDCGARLPGSPSAAPSSSGVAAALTQEASAVSHVPPAPIPVATPVPAPTPPVPSPEPIPAPPLPPPVCSIACGACGANNPPGVAFCEDCGASLSETPPPAVPTEFSPPVSYDPAPVGVQPPQPVAAPVAQARLIHTTGKEFPLLKDNILMGRRSPVDGVFPEVDLTDVDTESYISRKHGRITRTEEGFFFEDLGSSNGSFFNGNRVQAHVQQALKEGDSLRLGKTELLVRLH